MKTIRLLFTAAFAVLVPSLPAATVQLAGVITNDSGSQISQWRTPSAVKSLDADGDNVFGTTARVLFGIGQFGQGTVFRFDSSDPIVDYPNYATVDDVNGGADTLVHTTMNDGVPGADHVMFTFTALAGCPEHVRIGVATDGLDGAGLSPASIGLRKVGDSSAEQTLTAVNNTLDMAFFDVKGVGYGDQFEVFGDTGTGGFATIQLVTFDALPPNAPIVVTNASDAGPGSLRAALATAAAQAGADTIVFDAALNGKTIALSTSANAAALEIAVGEIVTVDASALSAGVKIDGGLQNFRLFTVNGVASLTLHGLTLANGGGSGFLGVGGAIYNAGTLNLRACTFAGNSITAGVGVAGAIYNLGTLAASQCTLSNNSASGSDGRGGAIFNQGTLTLTHCTLSGNSSSGPGGGIYNNFSDLNVTNTIVAGNNSAGLGQDICNLGTITRVGANVVQAMQNIGGTVTGSGTISNATPLLATLGNYGGPTQTMPPLPPTNPAIDTATAVAGLTTDQRGVARGAAIYTNDFSTGLGGATAFGSAADAGVVSGGSFLLTPNANDQLGSLVLPDLGSLSSFTASFDYTFNSFGGTPADGISFCFGPDPGYVINQVGDGMPHCVQFDIYNDAAVQYGVIEYRGPNGTVSNATALQRFADQNTPQPITITLASGGKLTVRYKGTVVLGPVATGYTYAAGDRIMFGSRTGASSAEQRIDNVGVLTQPVGVADIGAVEALSGPVNAVVTSNLDAGPGTLRDILAAVPTGSTITFDPAVFTGATATTNTVALTGPNRGAAITVNKAVTVDVTAIPSGVTIDGGSQGFHFFQVNNGASLTLRGLTLANGGGVGFSFGFGGAILNSGTLTLTRCTLSGNRADGPEGFAGAILNEGTATLTHCTLSGNSALNSGGAIYTTGTLTLTHCTLSGNTTTNGFGGGICNQAGRAMLTHCTLSGNTAPAGEGSGVASLRNANTETVVQNCIISGNTNSNVDIVGAGNLTNTFTSLGGNLIGSGNATGNFNAAGDILSNTPQLAPLGNYGGPTQTMALLPGSPARNAATWSAITSDQRGFPIAGLPDIGAYEIPNTPPTAKNTTATATTGDQKTITLHAFDLDGDMLTLTNTTPNSGLTVNSTSALDVTFTPATNFVGDAMLGYTVSDSNGATASGSITVTITDNDAPMLAAHADVSVLVPVLGDVAINFAPATATDNVTDSPTITYSKNPGDFFPPGTTTVTVNATDAAGNAATPVTFRVISHLSAPVNTVRYTKGNPAPDAGVLGTDGPPADALLASFGVPCVDDAGNVSFLAKWSSATRKGSGLFYEANSLVSLGGNAQGVTAGRFRTLSDPVGSAGHVALLATLTGVPAANTGVVLSNAAGGRTPQVIAQTGLIAPDATGELPTGGATFVKFKAVATSGGSVGIFAQLTGGTGYQKASAANDLGLWVKEGNFPLRLVLRKGQPLGSKIIKSLVSFTPGKDSPGQGRGWLTNPGTGSLLALVIFTDKTQAVVSSNVAGVVTLAETGDPIRALPPGAAFATFSFPTMNDARQNTFYATMKVGAGGVTKADAGCIFLGNADFVISIFAPYTLLARTGTASGVLGATFSMLKDPVLSPNGGIAFTATLKGGTAKGPLAQTLWWKPAGQPLALLAQGGAATVPDIASAQWAKFTSLAITDRGPIFAATLVPKKGAVTAKTASGVWACDFTGAPRKLFRIGDTINGKKLAKFTLLKVTVGNSGVTRSFNNNAQVVWLATFTDKSTAIIVTEVP